MKVLLVCARNYMPMDGGDKVLSYGLLKSLGKQAEVYLFNIADEPGFKQIVQKEISPYCKRAVIHDDKFRAMPLALLVSFFTGTPFLSARRRKVRKRKKELAQLIKDVTPEIIIWDHIRSTSYFILNPCFNILLEHNDEVSIYKEKVNQYSPLYKLLLRLQVGLLQEMERKMQQKMQRVVFLTEADRQNAFVSNAIFLSYPVTHFEVVNDKPVMKKDTIKLLFVGRLDWYPNGQGIKWFIQEVLPLLPAAFELMIVGRNPNKELLNLWQSNNRIELNIDVPSTNPYYKTADIFISPVFSGSGVNIKMLEAASFQMPIVASSFSKKGYSGLEWMPEASTATEFSIELNKLRSFDAREELRSRMRRWFESYLEQKDRTIYESFLQLY